jgi:hypothetical protein
MHKQLKGLRKQIEYVVQCSGLREHKWPEVRVDTWEEEEVIKSNA